MAQVYAFNDQNGETRLFAEIHPDPQPTAGALVPVADTTGVTVDTTTYDNPVTGTGKLATLSWPGDTVAVALGVLGDLFPEVLISPEGSDFLHAGDGTFDPYNAGAYFSYNGVNNGWQCSPLSPDPAAHAADAPRLSQISPRFTITSGALPTHDFTGQTGVGQQILTTRDVDIYVETGTAGSVVAALSPDNTTYTTIYTKTTAATDVCHARVPAGWYLKLTATTAVLGVGTYA